MKLHARHSSGKGVTLVEICVVTAVIALLLAVLYPAILSATQNSKDARCVANLRQFAVGFSLYAADHDGRIPPYKVWIKQPNGTSVGGAVWRTSIQPYLPIRAELETCLLEGKPFKNGTYYHYGMNPSFSGKINTVREPGKRLLVADSRNGQMRVTAPDKNGASDFSFRHRNFTHILFLDGHIEKRTVEETPGTPVRAQAVYTEFYGG